MDGRIEHERKKKLLIENKLSEYPNYLTGFYYSMYEKTYNTKYSYVCSVIRFLNFLKNKNLNIDNGNIFINLKKSTIEEYLLSIDHKKINDKVVEISKSHQARELFAIKNFFEYLVDEEIIDNNPCNKIEIPKEKKETNIIALTPDEVAVIKKNICSGVGNKKAVSKQRKWKERDYAIIQFGLHTGCRVSAISEINIEDINFEKQLVKVTEKGRVERSILLDQSTIDAIKSWLPLREKLLNGYPKTNALFISNRRKRIEPVAINKIIKKYSYNIDKKITPHKMRSTYATNLYNITGDIYIVSNKLGHKSVNTTKRYARPSEEKDKMVTALMNNLY